MKFLFILRSVFGQTEERNVQFDPEDWDTFGRYLDVLRAFGYSVSAAVRML